MTASTTLLPEQLSQSRMAGETSQAFGQRLVNICPLLPALTRHGTSVHVRPVTSFPVMCIRPLKYLRDGQLGKVTFVAHAALRG